MAHSLRDDILLYVAIRSFLNISEWVNQRKDTPSVTKWCTRDIQLEVGPSRLVRLGVFRFNILGIHPFNESHV